MSDGEDRREGLVMSSRHRAASALTIGALTVSVALLLLALLAPAEWSAWRVFAFVSAALWLAWALWGWPKIELDGSTVTVRNAMLTWRFGLRDIVDIEGGRKFTVWLSNGSEVTASAISGDGIGVEAWRRVDGATQGGHFVRNADDARPSRGPQSAAASWAKQLQERRRDASPSSTTPISRRVNWLIVIGSALAAALFILAVTVFP